MQMFTYWDYETFIFTKYKPDQQLFDLNLYSIEVGSRSKY